MHLLYLDESGSVADPSQQFFVLAGGVGSTDLFAVRRGKSLPGLPHFHRSLKAAFFMRGQN